MNKTKRFSLPIIIVILTIIISNYLVQFTDVELLTVFDTISLFSYFGVLIGFALTVYTFGLSMIGDIKSNIAKIDNLTKEDKKEMYQNLRNGFAQIKQNIWLIFAGIILVIFMSIIKNIENPFGWNVEGYQIPETLNLTMFLLSTIGMYDIMKTMFNLSEINMELIKDKD